MFFKKKEFRLPLPPILRESGKPTSPRRPERREPHAALPNKVHDGSFQESIANRRKRDHIRPWQRSSHTSRTATTSDEKNFSAYLPLPSFSPAFRFQIKPPHRLLSSPSMY